MADFEVGPNEPHTLEGVTVSIDQDDLGWEIAGFEPVDVIGHDRWRHWRLLNGNGADVPDLETLKLIYDEEWQALTESMAYDSEERATGIVVYPDWHDHAVTFKTWRNAAKGMFRRVGVDLDDIRIEEIRPEYHQTSDSFYVVWSQKQMDNYAGCKNAPVSTDYYQSILSGDVWFISVTDEDDLAEYECCGGFVGEYWSEYIQDEARQMFEGVLAEKRSILASQLAASIQQSRPDLTPMYA